MTCYDCSFVKRDHDGVPVVMGDDTTKSDRDRFMCMNIERLKERQATSDDSDRIVGMNESCTHYDEY